MPRVRKRPWKQAYTGVRDSFESLGVLLVTKFINIPHILFLYLRKGFKNTSQTIHANIICLLTY